MRVTSKRQRPADEILRWRAIVFGFAVLGVAACGGKSIGEDDGGASAGSPGPSGGGSSSASGSGATPTFGEDSGTGRSGTNTNPPPGPGPGPTPSDAAAPNPRDAAPSACVMGGGGGGSAGGGGGPVTCDIMVQESCGGVNYQVSCACPQGSCACFGTTTSIVSFGGCPTCPMPVQAFQVCGFPH